ncbi:MAG TPA: chromate transporter [Bacilli bacterium]|nr:chromate transporter [Bacilli bacterium]HQA19554.1 chromate transporter [Bacilli bacterium]HQD92441.1 chromate transporter [Bacilli bacterium]
MKNRYWDIFWTFFKIGAFTFGGGYAMIALMEREVVERKGWISSEEILDMIGISESTPGPIAINGATYIGYKVGKVWGAILATLGVVLPAFLVISVLSYFILKFKENQLIEIIFKGIRAGVVVLIFNAAYRLSKQLVKNILTYIIIVFVILMCLLTNMSVILILLFCAIMGIIYQLISNTRKIQKQVQDLEDNHDN